MPPRRQNDPPGLSDNPVCVTDPAREAELIAEFRRRVAYIEQSYRVGKLFYSTTPDLNHAIRALKSARERSCTGNYRRLPPMLEFAVSENARRFAEERSGRADASVEGEDIKRASRRVAECLTPISHRPRGDNLRHHVRGMMALIQDFSGRPVVPRRYRNSEYDPHFMPGVSQVVPIVFQHLEPSATIIQLVDIAEAARKEWAGLRPHFREFCPAYGLHIAAELSLMSKSGEIVAHLKPNIPTYFH